MLDLASLVVIAIAVVDAMVFAFGAYWAWEIRGALATPPYRRQALWVAAIASYFAIFFVFAVIARTFGVGAFSGTVIPGVAEGIFVYVGVLMFFVWIDSSVKVARRSDPLRRNTLQWSTLRWFLGFLVIVGTFFAIFFTTALNLTQVTPIYGPIGVTLFLGAIALYFSGRRSGDPVLLSHFIWFGLFAAFLWATGLVGGTSIWHSPESNPWVEVTSYSLFAISAYFLYRSARDLAPIVPLPPMGDPAVAPSQNP